MKSGKRKANSRPVPALTRADAEQVLKPHNIVWRHKGFCLLEKIRNTRDRDAGVVMYVRIRTQVYKVYSAMFPGEELANLRIFMGDAPMLFDISEAFEPNVELGESIEVTPTLQEIVIMKATWALQCLAQIWVDAIKKAPAEWNLERLMRHLALVSFNNHFGNGLDAVICEMLGCLPYSEQRAAVNAVMGREAFVLPAWLGTPDVQASGYFANRMGERRWSKIEKNSWRHQLQLNNGPLAIVTSTTVEVQAQCEELITRKVYGDLVLLVGEGQALEQEAKRLSNYLLGVDIVPLEPAFQ